MTHPAKIAEFSAEDYLHWELMQSAKHEFFRGEVFAMVGATRKHVTVAMNLSALLQSHLRGSSYRTYMSDMKLKVSEADAYFYPDLMVTCNAKDHSAENFLTAPILVIEILSASTEAYDRGEKFAGYRPLQTLKEYVLIDPESRRIEIYRRDDDKRWYLSEPDASEQFELQCIDLTVGVDQVFENV